MGNRPFPKYGSNSDLHDRVTVHLIIIFLTFVGAA